jgi:hypothetical protein
MHFMDIRRARSWLDGYNNEGDVADSEVLMDPNSDAHVDVDEWSNYIYFLITFINEWTFIN